MALCMLAVSVSPAFAEDEAPPVSIYGFARLDVLANDSRMSSLEQPTFVQSEPSGGQLDGAMTMTPRLSRVGLSIDPWELARHFSGEGKLEIDFGGGDGVNAIRLRHAYGQIGAFHDTVSLLVGQTNDLMSPLVPAAQQDTQLRDAGNLGDRRPQLRLTVTPPHDYVVAAVAIAASNTLDPAPEVMGQPVSTMPMFQWLLEARKHMKHGQTLRVGLSGHAGRETAPDGKRVESSSLAAHAFLPIARKFVILGEGFVGQNLADVGGGIGQGVDVMTDKPIHSAGGWAELALLPTDHHLFAVGSSIDTARAEDVEPGERTRNTTVYGVIRYKPKAAVQLGLEYLHWYTHYKEMTSGQANRFDLHFSVFF
jgi:hypothetical protein